MIVYYILVSILYILAWASLFWIIIVACQKKSINYLVCLYAIMLPIIVLYWCLIYTDHEYEFLTRCMKMMIYFLVGPILVFTVMEVVSRVNKIPRGVTVAMLVAIIIACVVVTAFISGTEIKQ